MQRNPPPSVGFVGPVNLDRKEPFIPFTQHGVSKQYPSSMRRPGNFTGNHFPSTTEKQAKKFQAPGRPAFNRSRFAKALNEINLVAGGEKRSIRRAMARAKVKNEKVKRG